MREKDIKLAQQPIIISSLFFVYKASPTFYKAEKNDIKL